MVHSRACPDCPATRTRTLEVLVLRPSGCAFRCSSVGARELLPSSWSESFGLALVRRGVVIRQRVDARGEAVAIDVAGAGNAMPIPERDDRASIAYAADDAMLCLCPRSTLERTSEDGGMGGHDVVRAQASMLARVERLAEARGKRHASSRVASLLLAISDLLVAGTRIDVIPAALRQRDLALLTALRHESVCRELKAFESRGLVARSAAGLRLLDRCGLEAM